MKHKFKIILFVITLLLLLSGTARASENFFEQRHRGWLWFDERAKEELEQDQETQQSAMPTMAQMEQAKAENEQFSKELELLKHLAIRYPENLQYITLYKLKEKEMMDKAVVLGTNWLMANFLNPDIVDELANPQNIYGRDLKNSNQKQSNNQILKTLTQKIELFVFRQEACTYCDTLEKHLQTFATNYGFAVEAVSPDSSISRYFKTYSSPEIISQLQLTVMPTVIAVVNDTRERFELARGAVSVADLEDKALLLAKYLGVLGQTKQALKGLQAAENINTKEEADKSSNIQGEKRGCMSCQER
ncbi:MAG: conjugal transfer protein TraF [Proteobacteria bacterium]|nr:conjugal transfer protein TraF [Pseudomonadota bacterium]